ncbi:hypothetical protein Mal15_51500 [Stieleria maiorica]|uniref:Uncharacterized protein n=2 Tax=Stieleria maiorica TaxID=2795974 RepID=A0A5B9MJM5_9BACT|nr:hypothetical protein Mal15_51500 [Stieleria maiorica]
MTFLCALAICPVFGCGGSGETTIVAAPENEATDDVPVEGMSDEEYARAMEKSMQQ